MNKQEKGWMIRKENAEVEEKEQARTELQRWEMIYYKAVDKGFTKKAELAKKRMEYWRNII